MDALEESSKGIAVEQLWKGSMAFGEYFKNKKALTISRKGIISLASPRGFEPLSTA